MYFKFQTSRSSHKSLTTTNLMKNVVSYDFLRHFRIRNRKGCIWSESTMNDSAINWKLIIDNQLETF